MILTWPFSCTEEYGKISLDTELSLSDVSETTLLTLYARAMEAQAYFGG